MLGIALGSGLGGFADHFKIRQRIPFNSFMKDLPPKVEGHARELLLAETKGKTFLIFSGRLHFYEGISLETLTLAYDFTIKNFGLERLVLTSVSGALQEDIRIGEWQQVNAFLPFPKKMTGFPDLQGALKPLPSCQVSLPQRTYAYQQGPSLGTQAEYKALRSLGADLVGMSMYPEYCFFRQTALPVWYWSFPVVNYTSLDNYSEPSHQEVMRIAQKGIDSLLAYFSILLKS